LKIDIISNGFQIINLPSSYILLHLKNNIISNGRRIS